MFSTPFSGLINLKSRPHRAAAGVAGVSAGASRRRAPPAGTSTT